MQETAGRLLTYFPRGTGAGELLENPVGMDTETPLADRGIGMAECSGDPGALYADQGICYRIRVPSHSAVRLCPPLVLHPARVPGNAGHFHFALVGRLDVGSPSDSR